MSRISIDVTNEEHQKLKALAALQGKSIKEFVLESTLSTRSGKTVEKNLAELEALLDERIRTAQSGAVSTRAVGKIFQEAYRDETGGKADA